MAQTHILTNGHGDSMTENLDSSEASPTKMIVDDIPAKNLKTSEASQDGMILGFYVNNVATVQCLTKG